MKIRTCLFTVSFAGFWGQQRLSLADAVDKTAELGFDGIEIMGKRPHLSPLDNSPDDCRRLRERLDERGLACPAVAGYTNFTGGISSAEVPFVEMQIAYVEELARRAKALGAEIVRIFASYERQAVPFATQWRRTVEAIRECCDRAAEHGVTIGLQNHHDIGVDTRTFCEMIHQVDRPNLLPLYDCWSVYLRGEDVAAGVRQMAPRMRFTTAADYVVLPRAKYRPELVNYAPAEPPAVFAAPMGQGDLPYRAFFETLADAGFEGWVSYELCSPTRDGGAMETLERYARAFLEYMAPWREAP